LKLPQDFIDEVLARTDIIELVEQRITLKKTGQANYQGLCPFHNEKSPSFSVNRHKQFYYCFGCKASGNAISFLTSYDKLTFPEAVEILAHKAGMSLPETSNHAPAKAQTSDFELLHKAANYFKAALKKHPTARDYLLNRGLTPDIIDEFGLGYAPSGWQNLVDAAGKTATSKTKLQEVGLIIQKGDRWFDRFRERVMFPIHNKKGQIIAFGGRTLTTEQPKYLNSPETKVFHKSRELYGLFQAIQHHRELDQLIVVEGYLDTISLHQFGIKNAVATLGTAITSNHIHLLLRLTNDVVFCFDGDSAGEKAAWRALEIVLPMVNEGIKVRFLFLPSGEDPDSFVRKVGKEQFLAAVNNGVSLSDFFFKKMLAQTEIETIAGKTRLVHIANKKLHHIPKGIFQELMFNRLANIVGISQDKIKEILEAQERPAPNPAPPAVYDSGKIGTPVLLALRLLLQAPGLAQRIAIPPNLEEIQLEGFEIIRKILSILNQTPLQTTGCLLEYFSNDPVQPLLMELAAQDLLIPDPGWQNELQGAFERILEANKGEQIQVLLAKGSKKGLTMDEKLLLQRLLSTRK
jgi:DNA primase